VAAKRDEFSGASSGRRSRVSDEGQRVVRAAEVQLHEDAPRLLELGLPDQVSEVQGHIETIPTATLVHVSVRTTPVIHELEIAPVLAPP
jgi:hypothetical protein